MNEYKRILDKLLAREDIKDLKKARKTINYPLDICIIGEVNSSVARVIRKHFYTDNVSIIPTRLSDRFWGEGLYKVKNILPKARIIYNTKELRKQGDVVNASVTIFIGVDPWFYVYNKNNDENISFNSCPPLSSLYNTFRSRRIVYLLPSEFGSNANIYKFNYVMQEQIEDGKYTGTVSMIPYF